MHLQQTKLKSRKTGGPQYWLQMPTDEVGIYLRTKRAVPVALMTPYGITRSDFMALDKDYKLVGGKPMRANAQHDRIQQARASESIGEAIRRWYQFPKGIDFERINIEIEIREGTFYLIPVAVKLRGRPGPRPIGRPENPLSFHRHFQSQLWRKQIGEVRKTDAGGFHWAISEISRIVKEHHAATPYVKEEDLLRAAGAFQRLGVSLGPYVGKGYDCKSVFRFLNYVPYEVPVEIKKRSAGFTYQEKKYGKEELTRAVILCMHHNMIVIPRYIDVVELNYLARAESLDS